ncbi:MAG: ATP-binding protein [Phycisphaerales bacterium]
MRSLKRTLVIGSAVSVILLTTVAGLSLYLMARAYLTAQFDAAMMRKAKLLTSMIEVDAGTLELGFEDLDMGEFDSAEAGGYLQFYSDRGSVYRSPSLRGHDLPTGLVDTAPMRIDWIDLPGGRAGRGLVFRFIPKVEGRDHDEADEADDDEEHERAEQVHGKTVVMCLARDTRDISDPLRALQTALIGVGLLLALLIAVVTYLAVGRAMRPVDDLAKRVGGIGVKTLSERIALSDVPTELAPIVEQFNGLLSRLSIAFERERCFSANMAHELRTPLAGLRTTIDVTRAKPRTNEEHERCLDQLLGVTQQMQVLVEGLLQLAKLESGSVTPVSEPVQLDDAVRRSWLAATGNVVPSKRYHEVLDLNIDGPINTDQALLAVVLRNVLHNALLYVDDGGTISIGSQRYDDCAEVRIANTGSRVTPEEAGKVFDRFWRADQARSQTGSRFGLGLSLTRLAVEAIGGGIHAESQIGGEFVITIRLPV